MYKKLLRPAALAALEQLAKEVPQNWGTPDDDLDMLAAIASISKAQKILQFGTAYGLSAVVLADIAAQNGGDAKLITVDPDQNMNAAAKRYCELAGVGGLVTVIDAFSTDPVLLRELKRQGEWDLIYLDTTHQYEHTRDEILLISPLCSERTVWLFHDASLFAAEQLDQRKQGGVARAIREFAALNPRWQTFTFQKPAFGQYGIGMLQKKPLA